MADLQKLVDELSKLTVIEAAELSKKLEEGAFRRPHRSRWRPQRRRPGRGGLSRPNSPPSSRR